jgi:MFS transporter, DHA2 family, multidrug resistance protein
MGLFFVPLNALAFVTISSAKLDEASGVMALMRNLGASIGIAVVSWLLVRQSQVNWENLSSHISPFNPAMQSYLSSQGLDFHSPNTIAANAQEIARQAQMIAFNDLFWFIGWITFAILPLLLLMKRTEKLGPVIA